MSTWNKLSCHSLGGVYGGNMSTWNKLSYHSLGEVYGGQYVHVEQAFISFPRWSLWRQYVHME